MGHSGPVRDLLLGHDSSPQDLADRLTDRMADAIVKDLAGKGIAAFRLLPGEPMPPRGWLVRGVFTQVDQGNQLRRAVIGFGMGATDIEVVTTADNLANGTPKPFYQVDTKAQSGKAPGAAVTAFVSPYMIPVHFIISHGDLNRNLKDTASKIADQVVQKVDASK
jgi:hypothetical protein